VRFLREWSPRPAKEPADENSFKHAVRIRVVEGPRDPQNQNLRFGPGSSSCGCQAPRLRCDMRVTLSPRLLQQYLYSSQKSARIALRLCASSTGCGLHARCQYDNADILVSYVAPMRDAQAVTNASLTVTITHRRALELCSNSAPRTQFVAFAPKASVTRTCYGGYDKSPRHRGFGRPRRRASKFDHHLRSSEIASTTPGILSSSRGHDILSSSPFSCFREAAAPKIVRSYAVREWIFMDRDVRLGMRRFREIENTRRLASGRKDLVKVKRLDLSKLEVGGDLQFQFLGSGTGLAAHRWCLENESREAD
jgi:hypothetical protein